MKLSPEAFEFRQCLPGDLDRLLDMQREALASLPCRGLLRENTPEMLDECLRAPNYTVGAWHNRELAGFSVLYYPQCEAEDLSLCLEGVEASGLRSANYKLCIVRPAYRGNDLQYRLGGQIISRAAEDGVELLCTTVSPDNPHSIRNIKRLGFVFNRTTEKYGFARELYCITF